MWKLDAVPILEEALTCLDDTADSKLLEINIHRQLGHKLAWDRAVKARAEFERACELTRSLGDDEKARLDSNPFRELAGHLEYFHVDLAAARNLADEAIVFGRKFRDVDDQIDTILFSRKFEEADRKKELILEARSLAIAEKNGDYLVKVLQSEVDDMWAKGVVPGFEAKASRMANDVLTHWQLIHDKQAVCVGHIWGMQLQLDANKRAAEIEALIEKLPERSQQDCADEAAQRLRMAGKLQLASELYDQAYLDEPWSPTFRARCRSAARNFAAAVPLLERGIEISSKQGTSTRLWIGFERATMLEAQRKTVEAKAAYTDLIPELLAAQANDTHSATLLVYALSKTGQWDQVGSDTLESMQARISQMIKGDERYIFNVLHTLALAAIEEHCGNERNYIDLLIKANRFRPGTFESFDCEWIPDKIVDLLIASGDVDRLEQILREDIQHRDESLPAYHPERAYTRIRLAKYLLDTQRDVTQAMKMLNQAKTVYAYHGDWIPHEEHDALASLLAKASTASSNETEER